MADIKSTVEGLEKIAEVFWRRYETADMDKAREYADAHDTVTDAIELLKEYENLQERHEVIVDKCDDMYAMLKEGKMKAEMDLEELVKEAIETCADNKCNECPFKGSPARCLAILMHKLNIRC